MNDPNRNYDQEEPKLIRYTVDVIFTQEEDEEFRQRLSIQDKAFDGSAEGVLNFLQTAVKAVIVYVRTPLDQG